MKLLIIKIKDIFPYLILISIYFLFVNIEAQKSQYGYQRNEKILNNQKNYTQESYPVEKNDLRVKIPVIPYKK